MKTPIALTVLLTVALMFGGCASPQQRRADLLEQEFRKQLAESIPVKEHGYMIKEIRFSPDKKKALVVFTHPENEERLKGFQVRPDWEFVLTDDEFGRYRGMTMQPFYSPGTANTPPVWITVSLPM